MSDLTPHSGITSGAATALHSATLVIGAVVTEEPSITMVSKTRLNGLLRAVIHFMTDRIETPSAEKFEQNLGYCTELYSVSK